MSCVHYKFSSKLNYDTVTFDGLHISLCDLKKQIMGREKLKAADCDLQITNAQTKEGKSRMGSRDLLVGARDRLCWALGARQGNRHDGGAARSHTSGHNFSVRPKGGWQRSARGSLTGLFDARVRTWARRVTG